MTGVFPKAFVADQKVRKDWIDLRDQTYVPGLSVLPDAVSLHRDLFEPGGAGLIRPVFGVRDQGMTGRCVGYALAHLIDVQRAVRRLRDPDADLADLKNVSADMLYNMAFFHDRYPNLEQDARRDIEGIRTLRAGIKGFYHHGVCLDFPGDEPEPCHWKSYADTSRWTESTPEPGFPTVAQAKSARHIGLGAYYRLAPLLNHFHAALSEAETILASAEIHDGWLRATPANGGVIQPPERGDGGTHAFVITGYDSRGFHVLNSWGPDWGGYNNRAGIGLWRYEDWARSVHDAWVLRLGVHAPAAFDASIGEQGIAGVIGPARAGSTPCLELVGHYVHLDDGFKVTTGAYPSFSDNWGNTKDYLKGEFSKSQANKPCKTPNANKPYKGLLIWIPGSFEGIKPAFDTAVRRKPLIKALGLYPYTIFWCNSFVQKSMEVLQTLFDSCAEQAGDNAEHLNDLIEMRLRGVGRAFWRDIEMSALRAVRGPHELPFEKGERPDLDPQELGYVGDFLADVMELKAQTGCEVHIVAEGAGALVVHEMLSALAQDTDNDVFGGRRAEDSLDTLHLVHPAIGLPRTNMHLSGLIARMNGDLNGKSKRRPRADHPVVTEVIDHKTQPRARIYVPDERLEDRVRFGRYGKSILHLVARAFEDRLLPRDWSHKKAAGSGARGAKPQSPRTFLGMALAHQAPNHPAPSAVYRLNTIRTAKRDTDPITQTELNTDTTIQNFIFETIRESRKSLK